MPKIAELADHVLDLVAEEACYIAGETAEKMYKVASKFLCEHCRHK